MNIFGKKRRNFSSSSRYSSVSMRRNDLIYSRASKNRLISYKSLLLKIIIVLVLIGLSYTIFVSTVFKVARIDVTGNTQVNADEVRAIAEEISNRRVLKYFNNNLVLINTEEIGNSIREKFSSIKQIKVIKKFPKTISISIMEKPVDIQWCNKIKVEKISSLEKSEVISTDQTVGENLSQDASQCYFSDDENIIYTKSQNASERGGIRIFRDETINIGDKIADDNVKNFIRDIAKNFNAKTGLEYSYLYLPPVSSKELHLITKDGWKIYFDLNRPADGQLDILNNVWRDSIPENYKKDNNVEYIDLRVQERVSWMPKSEAQK